METKKYPLLTKSEQKKLYDALHYMKMAELKKACQLLSISDSGKKVQMIDSIMGFIQTGVVPKRAKIPAISRAKKPLFPTP